MTGSEQTASLVSNGDSALVLIASILAIAFGAIGTAMFAAAQVTALQRSRVILQSACVAAMAVLCWTIIGYEMSFGGIGNGWIGNPKLGLSFDVDLVRPGTRLPESIFALLRLAFALMATMLLVGAWAGRARLSWLLSFSLLWGALVLAPIAHWLWGGGWLLTQIGTIDYAGGLAVHTSAGVSALVVALLMGPISDLDQNKPKTVSPNLAALGAALIVSAALALNGASALSANHNAASAILGAFCATLAGALAWLALENASEGEPSLMGFAKGSITGIASIASASVYVSPSASIIIGIAAAIACFGIESRLKSGLGIDDASSVFALHGIGGIIGTVLLSLFLSEQWGGTGYFGAFTMSDQFAAQAIGIAVVAGWSAVGTAIIALGISMLAPMRADNDEQSEH